MNFTVPMALMDMLPVICFGAAGIILMRDLYNKMSKGAYALFSAGCINVFMAGFLKALYKLLYAAGICDFEKLSQMFFPVQALGFTLAGLGAVAMLLHNQGEGKIYSFAPAGLVLVAAAGEPQKFSGVMIFVVLMVLGLGCLNAVLSIISVKIKKPGAIVFFVIAFIFSLMMGYLSSKDFAQSSMNWIAEGVNTIGQGSLLIGAHLLHKAGLGKATIK